MCEGQLSIYERHQRMIIKRSVENVTERKNQLPYELRTESALKFTMDYIVQIILTEYNEFNSEIQIFYPFVSDRLCSIRQDIEHQRMNGPNIVQIMEQCTRFHIHYGVLLMVSENTVDLSRKNSDYLADCLAALELLYDDKNNEYLNKAEFGTYMLLNELKDDFNLLTVQQITTKVSNGPQLHFITRLQTAMQANNVTELSDVIVQSEYMLACISLLYCEKDLPQTVAKEVYSKIRQKVKTSASFCIYGNVWNDTQDFFRKKTQSSFDEAG